MDTDAEDILTITEAVERTGLSAHTLRYYERVGAIDPPGRSPSGHRRYRPEDVGWLALVKCLRDTGMPISSMRRFADLIRAGDDTARERKELLAEHRAYVVSRIERLQSNLALIDTKIDHYGRVEREG